MTQIKTIEPPVSDIVYLIRPTVIGRDDLVRTVECTNLGAGMENMSKAPSTTPFSQPEKLAPGLAHVHAYWEDLKRGAANMPFADDVNIATMPDMAGRLMLIEVFDKPVRFRLAMLGEQIKGRNGDDAVGKFLDEIEVHAPLQYLIAIERHHREPGPDALPAWRRPAPRAHPSAGWLCPDPASVVGKRPHSNAARGGHTGITRPFCSCIAAGICGAIAERLGVAHRR